MNAAAVVEAPMPIMPLAQPQNNPPLLALGSNEAGSAPFRHAGCPQRSSKPAQAEAVPPGPALHQAEWPVGAEHQGRRVNPENFKPDGPCAICGDTRESLPLCLLLAS